MHKLWSCGLLFVALAMLVVSCAHQGSRHFTKSSAKTHTEKGLASWYGGKFHGRRTASGERFNRHALTAAHRTLPFGTKVEVTNLDNGKSVDVTINDRGPFVRRRVIDLSQGAAQRLGLIPVGVAPVRVKVIEPSL